MTCCEHCTKISFQFNSAFRLVSCVIISTISINNIVRVRMSHFQVRDLLKLTQQQDAVHILHDSDGR